MTTDNFIPSSFTQHYVPQGAMVFIMAVVGCSLCIWIIYNIISGVMRLAGGQVS